MVPALSGCDMRNLHDAKATFYLIGNTEIGWEFQIVSIGKLCFLSEESIGTRKECFAISLQHCASALSGETLQLGSSGVKRKSHLKAPCHHGRQREDIRSMTT